MNPAQQHERRIALNREQLIAAHRAKDYDLARKLSQEKERLKRQRVPLCAVCKVPLSRQHAIPATHCQIHANMKRYYSKALARAASVMAGLIAAVASASELPPMPVTIAPHPRDLHWAWSMTCATNEVVGFNLYWFDGTGFHWQWAGYDPLATEQNAWLSNAVPPVSLRLAAVGTNLVSGDDANAVWPPLPPPVTNIVLTIPVMRGTNLFNRTLATNVVLVFTNGCPQEYFSVGKLSIQAQ